MRLVSTCLIAAGITFVASSGFTQMPAGHGGGGEPFMRGTGDTAAIPEPQPAAGLPFFGRTRLADEIRLLGIGDEPVQPGLQARLHTAMLSRRTSVHRAHAATPRRAGTTTT